MPSGVQFVAGDRAAELFQVGGAGIVERVAEGVVRRDEVPLLAVLAVEQIGHRVRFHPRRVADAIDVPVAVLAGDRIGVTAGDDVQNLLFGGDLRYRRGDAGIHVADNEIDVVALDQLACLLHAGADVIGRVFDQQLDLPPEDAALGVDLLDGVFGADDFVSGRSRIDTGQRIDHSHLDVVGRPGRDHEGRCDLHHAGGCGRLEHRAAIKLLRNLLVFHCLPPFAALRPLYLKFIRGTRARRSSKVEQNRTERLSPLPC